MDTVRVSIPANAEFLHVLRAVVGGVGVLAEASIDVIDDLRLSVDEACSQLLSQIAADRLSMDVSSTGDTVEVVAAVDGTRDPWPPPGAEETLGWQVLRALSDRPAFERGPNGGAAIRFAKSLRGG